MSNYAILGFGRARSSWLTSVSTWANSGALPAAFTKCVSAAEVTQRLQSLQPWSVLLLDAQLAKANQGIVEAANEAGVPVLAIGEVVLPGAEIVSLPSLLGLAELAQALTTYGKILNDAVLDNVHSIIEAITAWQGKLIAVCGPGGTGASTVAMAIAQGFGKANVDDGSVLLADFARNHELAMLHDVSNTPTSIEDAVSLYRVHQPDAGSLRALTLSLPHRHYAFLPGLLRATAWSTLSARSISNAIDGMTKTFLHTVVDITADFEGESESGSSDVEERNALSRLAASKADLVVVVGAPGVKGTHSLSRTIRELLRLGVGSDRMLVVVNRAPKSLLARGAQKRAIQELIDLSIDIVFVKEFAVDAAIHDGVNLPNKYVKIIFDEVSAKLASGSVLPNETVEPERITPGSLGLGSADAS